MLAVDDLIVASRLLAPNSECRRERRHADPAADRIGRLDCGGSMVAAAVAEAGDHRALSAALSGVQNPRKSQNTRESKAGRE